jgi:hypothetical protein
MSKLMEDRALYDRIDANCRSAALEASVNILIVGTDPLRFDAMHAAAGNASPGGPGNMTQTVGEAR